MTKGENMTKIEILNYLELIESELTDAYNTAPDTSENSDTLYYIDTAQDLLNELRHNIENNVEKDPRGEYEFNEAMNGMLLGGDGEGRLKGNN